MSDTQFKKIVEEIARSVAICIDGKDITYKLYLNEVRDEMIKKLIKNAINKIDFHVPVKQLLNE